MEEGPAQLWRTVCNFLAHPHLCSFHSSRRSRQYQTSGYAGWVSEIVKLAECDVRGCETAPSVPLAPKGVDDGCAASLVPLSRRTCRGGWREVHNSVPSLCGFLVQVNSC